MHEKVLPKGSLALLNGLEGADPSFIRGWVLAEGTGLALRLGHRVSEDFDFFRTDEFSVEAVHGLFKKAGAYETLQESERTLTVLARGVKVSFFQIPDPFIFAVEPYRGFSIADIRDIALMKLIAVSGRGSRKDFIDLYFILKGNPTLTEYFGLLSKKYAKGRANAYHILKSLTYFDDAEAEPMPRMLAPFEWKECKAFFVRQAHSIVLPGK
ncbi:MAG: nucleotidyl transferase AbiEii/AbiGii toxin family protein [Proteobacteria bacterium]|nr:nucleotidyl transferase AbiEii/AbiGii toxin family protein [Pseudomonadota bacterium]